MLLHHVQSPEQQWPDDIKDYQKVSDDLATVDGVVMFKGRVVIPNALRHHVLRKLHLAHQGTSSMALWTSESVWWPGLNKDLEQICQQCITCTKNAPSQQPMP